jgi:hypothetical protein
VNRLTDETITVYQATGLGLIRGILCDNLAAQNTEENLVKGQMICLGFFVGVVGNADTVITDCVNYVLNVQEISLPNAFSVSVYLDTVSWQRTGSR